MKRRDFLKMTALGALSQAALPARGAAKRPNVLFLTVDDMSCDSIGVFGCPVPGTTPRLDAFASEGMRFAHAHVQVANCYPSRNVMQTGRYPHSSGVEGFYQVKTDIPVLPGVLKANGYYIGIKNKVSHSTPYNPYPWDVALDPADDREYGKGNPDAYTKFTSEAIAASKSAGKPFYLVVNISDPHLPFYGMGKGATEVPDKNVPTRVFTPEEIVVPGFLPDLPIARRELAHYYSSVRRADDCAAATLAALEASGEAENTVVMFLSDHGMPFPFAKTNMYYHSTHTPWMVRWPGVVQPGAVDARHMISAVDFMPAILDIVGLPHPEGLEGRSFLPLLRGEPQPERDHVICEYDENSGGARHPMRAVQTRETGYIFNPWSNGTRKFRTATQGMETYKEMTRLAMDNRAIGDRLQLFDYRTPEEFYDYKNDPDALHNLIGDPRYQEAIAQSREILEAWMVKTADPYLESFQKRDDPAVMEAMVNAQQAESDARRSRGRATQAPAKRQTGLIALVAPKRVKRGGRVTVEVRHTLPADLKTQKAQVTLKGGGGERIERKIEDITGEGTLRVTFAVPADPGLKAVSFAAFVGEDYPVSLEHVTTKPIPVE